MPERVEKSDQYNRDNQSEKLLDFLDRIQVEQVFGSEKSKREFLSEMNFENFKDWLERINGILRNIPIAERTSDGENVALVPNPEQMNWAQKTFAPPKTEYPPQQEDKEPLLRELFNEAKKMIERGDNLQDVALLVSAGINAIHNFVDGNGRTSRFLNFMLENEYTGSQEQKEYLKKILGDKGRLFLNIDPGEAKKAINDYIFSQLGIDQKNEDVPQHLSTRSGGKEAIDEKVPPEFLADFKEHILGNNSDFGFFAVYEFLKDKGALEEFITHLGGGDGRAILRIVDLVDKLHPEDYKEIMEKYWKFKKEAVSALIRALANPEKFKTEQGKTIKESFLKNVDGSYLHSFKEVNMENIAEIWQERETLEFSTETIPQEVMVEIIRIKARLAEIAEQEKQERANLDFDFEEAGQEFAELEKRLSPDLESLEERDDDDEQIALEKIHQEKQRIYRPVIELENKFLQQVLDFLDGLALWQTKFTTRNNFQFVSEAEKEETDSIYFVTKTGQSLRIRKHDLVKKGLAQCIEPFMEKIFYTDKQYESSQDKATVFDEVKVDSFTREFVTDEFLEAQQAQSGNPQNFVSRIRRYQKDGKIIYLNPVDGHGHKGCAINKIFTF